MESSNKVSEKVFKKKSSSEITRRRFLKYAFEAGIAVGLVASVNSLSRGGNYIRPPGSVLPEEFTSKCMRCSVCVEVCPSRAIRMQDLTWDLKNISTPVIDTEFGGCTHWEKECLKCAESCPTGALDKTLVKKSYKMASVNLNAEGCVNCMVCFEKCPVEGAVLFPNPGGEPFSSIKDIPTEQRLVNSKHKPYINSDKCVGCGLCVHYCPQKIMNINPLGKSK